MSQPDSAAPPTQTARVIASWLIVGIPLLYGIYQTIRSVLPLFGG